MRLAKFEGCASPVRRLFKVCMYGRIRPFGRNILNTLIIIPAVRVIRAPFGTRNYGGPVRVIKAVRNQGTRN